MKVSLQWAFGWTFLYFGCSHKCLADGSSFSFFQPHAPILLDEGLSSLSTTTTNTSTSSSHNNNQNRISPRIAGGTLAAAGDFPYYISPTRGLYCGAVLIHPDIALSAAHCANAFAPGTVVYVGAWVRGTNAGGAIRRRVTTVLRHPLYRKDDMHYDFLLFQLNQPVLDVRPVTFNTDPNVPVTSSSSLDSGNSNNSNSPPQPLVVMGFGSTGPDQDPTFNLRQATLWATDNDTCQRANGNLFERSVMLCAGDPDNPTSACQGDSGGPLMIVRGTSLDEEGEANINNDNDNNVVVGVVSFGLAEADNPFLACGNPEIPTVYARVSAVADWIIAGICAMSDSHDVPTDHNNNIIDCTNVPDIVIPSMAPTPMTSAPTLPPLTVTLSFVVQYDANPHETEFFILTRPEGRQLASSSQSTNDGGGNSNLNPYSRLRYRFSNAPLGSYEFVMVDSGEDGLSSGLVKGYVEIYQHVIVTHENENEEQVRSILIAYGTHDFALSLNIPFDVTEDPVAVVRPTPAPVAAGPILAPPSTPSQSSTAVPTLANFPTTSTAVPPSSSSNNNNNKQNDDENTNNGSPPNGDTIDGAAESDFLGMGLSDTVSYLILGGLALLILVVFALLIRYVCCNTKPSSSAASESIMPR